VKTIVKTITTVRIDDDLRKQARKKNINISGLLDLALRKELDIMAIQKANELICFSCGIPLDDKSKKFSEQKGLILNVYCETCAKLHKLT